MNIGIACDHRGYILKNKIIKYLKTKGHNITDYGTNSVYSTDYPLYAFKLCEGINSKEVTLGIAICGTGIGISIACNKVKGIRCAKVNSQNDAKYCRLHNNANIIAISGDILTFKAKDYIDIFLNTPFSNEEKHIRRLGLIDDYENKANHSLKKVGNNES